MMKYEDEGMNSGMSRLMVCLIVESTQCHGDIENTVNTGA